METVDESSWLLRKNGTTCLSSNAIRMAKMRRIKPIVDQIKNTGSVEDQGATIRAVNDHRDLAAACQVSSIDVSKDAVTTAYVCQQLARMIGRARRNKILRGKKSQDKRDAVEAVLMMMEASPNKLADAPSMRKRARLMGIPKSTFHQVDKTVMDKRARLTDEEEGVY